MLTGGAPRPRRRLLPLAIVEALQCEAFHGAVLLEEESRALARVSGRIPEPVYSEPVPVRLDLETPGLRRVDASNPNAFIHLWGRK